MRFQIYLILFALILALGCTKGQSSPKDGAALLREKQCLTCHTLDGKKLVGPSFKGVFGKKETVITKGKEREITVDEAYLRQSIKNPNADVVKGYPPNTMAILVPVNDQEIEVMIKYLKTLK